MNSSRIEADQMSNITATAGNGRTAHAVHTQPRGNMNLSSEASTPRALARKKRRRRNRFLLLVFLVAASAIAAGAWFASRGTGSAKPIAETATVQRRDFSASVLATGAVQPQVGAEVRVGARISGRVAGLKANIGDRVVRGQVIAELEKADLEAIVAQREAELQLAEAKLFAVERLMPTEIQKAQHDISRWQASCQLSQQVADRETQLLSTDATSAQAVEEAQERLSVAKAELASTEKAHELLQARYEEDRKQASAEIARAQSALANAKVQLSYATITAPIDGVIASVSTQEGETVAAGMQAPTFVTIIDLERLQVDAYVDEVDIGKVHPGQEALFTVDTFPGREFKGRVTAIYPKAVIQDNVVNYDVVVDILDEHGGILRPEMTASVTVLLEQKTGVLAIPAKAVKREQGKNVVYLAGDGRPPQMHEITVGWKDGQWIEVLSGLEEGQTVFLETPAPSVSNPAQ
jgi:multidrug efflux pump subunit AcrA (membrane-fusion protein)